MSLTVLGYHIFKISNSFGDQKLVFFRFSALGSSRTNGVRSESGFKNINNRTPSKKYTNPPENIRPLPVLQEQLKFYVPQNGHALVPFRLCGVNSDIKIGFLVSKLVCPRISGQSDFNFFEKKYYFNLGANYFPMIITIILKNRHFTS